MNKMMVVPLSILVAAGLSACGDDQAAPAIDTATSSADVQTDVAAGNTAVAEASEEVMAAEAVEDVAASAETPADAEVQEIDAEDLQLAGTIELKQYTVAWVGSGTMGGGTLTIDGKDYPFRLAGLGIGGYGASSVDAEGTVYNLPHIDAFSGTYGNARLGMTGGDSGGGRLWLRNPDGVVIELHTKMRGLALNGGVDGILIQWDSEYDSTVDRAMDTTRDTAGDAIEAGADAVQDGVDNVKGWFKKKG